MPYTKTQWNAGAAPGISAETLNNIEQGISEAHWFAATTNAGNAYSATLDPAPTAYVTGMIVRLQISADATGAVTINLNGLGGKNVKKSNGAAVTNWKLNAVVTLAYNGTNFISQGEGGSGNATAGDVLQGKTASADIGDIVGSMPNRSAEAFHQPAVEVSGGGTRLYFRPPNGFFDGSSWVYADDPELTSGAIRAGYNIFGVQGDAWVVWTGDSDLPSGRLVSGYSGWSNGQRIVGSMPNNGLLDVTPSSGDQYFGWGMYDNNAGTGVIVRGDGDLQPGNIRGGVNIFGVQGNVSKYAQAAGTTRSGTDGFLQVGGLGFTPITIMLLYPGTTNPYASYPLGWYNRIWGEYNVQIQGQSRPMNDGSFARYGEFRFNTYGYPSQDIQWSAAGYQ